MKNYSLIIFILSLIFSTISNKKLLNTQNQSILSWENMATAKTDSISDYNKVIWIFSNGNLFQHKAPKGSISGTKPTSVRKLVVVDNGTLFMLSNNNELYKMTKHSDSSYSIKKTLDKVTSFSCFDYSNCVGVIEGKIYYLPSGIEKGQKYSDEKLSDSAEIIMRYDTSKVEVFVMDQDKFFLLSSDKKIDIGKVGGLDLCIHQNKQILIAGKDGIYYNDGNSVNLIKVDSPGRAKKISCSNNEIWIIGLDNMVYRSNWVFDTNN